MTAAAVVISWLLMGLTVVNWWAVAVVWRAKRFDGTEMTNLFRRFTLTALAATCFGLLGANWLLGLKLIAPPAGFFVLWTGTLLISAPALYFLFSYYRRR